MNKQVEQQSRLKQRLVGAIVLVALGVIFIPMLLDGEREQDFIVDGSSVPPRPEKLERLRRFEFDTGAAAGKAPVVKAPPAAAGQRIPVDERSAPLPAPPAAKTAQPEMPPPAKPAAGQPEAAAPAYAWAVQAGSFRQKQNALRLRDRLRGEKYKAFVEAIRRDGQQVYRVRLGPYVKRSTAEAVRKRLLARQQVKGVVVRHP